MPSVGKGKNKKTFPYTAKGKDDAKKMAKKTGKKMTSAYKHGGMVQKKKPVKKMMGGGKVGHRKK